MDRLQAITTLAALRDSLATKGGTNNHHREVLALTLALHALQNLDQRVIEQDEIGRAALPARSGVEIPQAGDAEIL